MSRHRFIIQFSLTQRAAVDRTCRRHDGVTNKVTANLYNTVNTECNATNDLFPKIAFVVQSSESLKWNGCTNSTALPCPPTVRFNSFVPELHSRQICPYSDCTASVVIGSILWSVLQLLSLPCGKGNT